MVYLLAKIPVISLDDYASDDETLKKASDSIERNGLLLGEEEILRAMNDELSPSFLAGISEGKGAFVGDALTSQARFEELFSEMEKVILKITSDIRSGYADARPLQYNGKNPCDYCEAKSVCRYTEKNEMED
jgi:ATP-dependent helicase/nuclease subunit B